MQRILYLFLFLIAQTYAAITPVTPATDSHGCYLISTAGELYGFAELINSSKKEDVCAKLEADITLNKDVLGKKLSVGDTVFREPQCIVDGDSCEFNVWTPIGHSRFNSFRGIFDGQGHTVRGIFIDSPDSDTLGFFSFFTSGYLYNLNIEDSYIRGGNGVGGIVGKLEAKIDNCSFEGSVEGKMWTGGIVGYGLNTYIFDSRNYGSVKGTLYVGGIAGYAGILYYCFNAGFIDGVSSVGGVSGWASYVTRSYNLATVRGKDYTAGLTGRVDGVSRVFNMGYVISDEKAIHGPILSEFRSDDGTIEYSYSLAGVATEVRKDSLGSAEILDSAAFTDGTLVALLNRKSFSDNWVQGEGHPVLKNNRPEIKDGVILIATEEQLMWYADYYDGYRMNSEKVRKTALTNNLKFNEGVDNAECILKDSVCDFVPWRPLNPYNGIFDGRGHSISGLYMDEAPYTGSGFFSILDASGVVENLMILDSYFQGKYVGGVVGRNNGVVRDCYANAQLRIKNLRETVGEGRGVIVGDGNAPVYTYTFLKDSLWFDGRTDPAHFKYTNCFWEGLDSCLAYVDAWSTDTYSDGNTKSEVFFPYPSYYVRSKDLHGDDHFYVSSNQVAVDSLGYVVIKYRLSMPRRISRVSLDYNFYYPSRELVDVSGIDGVCATYTSDDDMILAVKNGLFLNPDVSDSLTGVKLHKSDVPVTVEIPLSDFENPEKFKQVMALSFVVQDSVGKDGILRIFEFGAKGSCKGNKKIASDEPVICKQKRDNVCVEEDPPLVEKTPVKKPTPSVILVGRNLLVKGVSSKASFAIVNLKGKVVERGTAMTLVSLKDLNAGLYAVLIKDGSASFIKKLVLK
ncbi:T9SS type A sorting domain-containing protein [uncultured Fibrobacter sp.]|uniref:T9SS type A sorting domain-containing protein n=1 Tax=uncultured Fibrobacter sp. TaxID=261512 RepID=UPI0025F2BD3A|nr:T9SS type A sorting domain-containing protein [uncultured Fibrobacter sp.]